MSRDGNKTANMSDFQLFVCGDDPRGTPGLLTETLAIVDKTEVRTRVASMQIILGMSSQKYPRARSLINTSQKKMALIAMTGSSHNILNITEIPLI